jgi:hypothetical protein
MEGHMRFVVVVGARMSVHECTDKSQFVGVQRFSYWPKFELIVNLSISRKFEAGGIF